MEVLTLCMFLQVNVNPGLLLNLNEEDFVPSMGPPADVELVLAEI